MAALAFHGARKTRRHRVRRRITGTERSNASPINRAGGGAKAPPCWHPCAGYSSPSPVASLDRRQPVHGLTPRVLAAAHPADRRRPDGSADDRRGRQVRDVRAAVTHDAIQRDRQPRDFGVLRLYRQRPAAVVPDRASASWSVEIPPTPLLQRRIGCEPNLRGYHRTSFGHHRDTDKAERRLFRARIQCVAPPEAAPFLSNATGRIVTMRTTPSKAKQSA